MNWEIDASPSGPPSVPVQPLRFTTRVGSLFSGGFVARLFSMWMSGFGFASHQVKSPFARGRLADAAAWPAAPVSCGWRRVGSVAG